VEAMDQGVLAADIHHKQAAESVQRGEAAENAFLAQREVVLAKNALQLYRQHQEVPANSTGHTMHTRRRCC
jgi:hypothetical protein